jgi:hypothetical protein
MRSLAPSGPCYRLLETPSWRELLSDFRSAMKFSICPAQLHHQTHRSSQFLALRLCARLHRYAKRFLSCYVHPFARSVAGRSLRESLRAIFEPQFKSFA